jgi:creatinine amidohydrolase/Fe(II)-dependent formamide hydrolase-like protein
VHAGEIETSMMLALRPHHVDMARRSTSNHPRRSGRQVSDPG